MPLSASLLLFKIKAGDLNNIEEADAHHSGNVIIHIEKALSESLITVTMRHGVHSCVEDSIVPSPTRDDVKAVVVLTAAFVRVYKDP